MGNSVDIDNSRIYRYGYRCAQESIRCRRHYPCQFRRDRHCILFRHQSTDRRISVCRDHCPINRHTREKIKDKTRQRHSHAMVIRHGDRTNIHVFIARVLSQPDGLHVWRHTFYIRWRLDTLGLYSGKYKLARNFLLQTTIICIILPEFCQAIRTKSQSDREHHIHIDGIRHSSSHKSSRHCTCTIIIHHTTSYSRDVHPQHESNVLPIDRDSTIGWDSWTYGSILHRPTSRSGHHSHISPSDGLHQNVA